MPQVGGVLETALYVEDLERSVRFYQSIFHFETLFFDQRLCALNVADRQVLLLFKRGADSQPSVIPGGTIPPTDGSGHLHLAFTIPAAEIEQWEKWLGQNGVSIESRVSWERGGQSLYFRDHDHNLLELVTPGCWSIY